MPATPEINTLLSFDFGTRRIGLAVGALLLRSATPLGVISNHNNRPDWATIEKHIQEWLPQALVVGVPIDMDGRRLAITAASERFMRRLTGRFQLPVYGVDERLSSVEAARRMEGRKNVALDAVAAQVIMETWFNECGIAP